TLQGGSGKYAFAQIGHGGCAALAHAVIGSATISGPIGVTSAGDLSITGGSGVDAYAQIGHGGSKFAYGMTATGAIETSGDITVGAASVTLRAGYASAQIGNGGLSADRLVTAGAIENLGTISVSASGGGVSLTGGTGVDAFALIGHGGAD